jgi:hypothetical protein
VTPNGPPDLRFQRRIDWTLFATAMQMGPEWLASAWLLEAWAPAGSRRESFLLNSEPPMNHGGAPESSDRTSSQPLGRGRHRDAPGRRRCGRGTLSARDVSHPAVPTGRLQTRCQL